MNHLRIASAAFTLLLSSATVQAQTVACEGNSLLLSSGAEADDFQWQSSTGGNWTSLEEAAPYSGTTEESLLIEIVEMGMDALSVRCLIPSAGSATPDSTAYLTTLNVIEALAASEIAVSPSSSAFENCHGVNSITLVQSAAASGSDGAVVTEWQVLTDGMWNTLNEGETELTLTDLTESTVVRQISQSSGDCSETVFSNALEIDVYAPLTLPILLGAQQICVNSSPVPLASSSPSGGSGTSDVQWQHAVGGQGWSDIEGADALVYAPGILTESTAFRIVATDSNGCGTVTSNSVTIDVFDPISPSIIALDPSSSLTNNCHANNVVAFTQASESSGTNGAIDTQWQQLIDGVWVTLTEPQEDLVLTNLTENTSVRQMSSSSGPCGGTVFSNVIAVDVFEPVVAGDISEDQTICFDAIPAAITAFSATGGSSDFTYQWQSALPGSGWTSIPNANALFFQPGPLEETTAYRLLASDNEGCDLVFTESMLVTVAAPLVAGVMTVTQDSICFGGDFNASSTATTGGIGPIVYDWLLSVDSGAFQSVNVSTLNWQGSAVDADFVEVVLSSVSTGGCGSVQSEAVYVEVLSPVASPSIQFLQFSADSILCYGDMSPSLQLAQQAFGADGLWTYSWQTAVEDEVWMPIQNDSALFSPGSANGSFEVRIEATSEFGCGQVSSNVLEVNTYDLETGPVVDLELGDFGICFETSPGSIETLTPPTGGTDTWSYQWQFLEGGFWLPIPGDTLDGTFIPPLSESQSFRLQAQDSICATVHSNTIEIEVFDPLDETLTIESSALQTLCDVNNGVTVQLSSLPSGGGNQFTYAWFEQGSQLPQELNTQLDVAFIEDSTTYAVTATSTEGCGSIESNIIEVNVYEALGTYDASENQVICNDFTPEIISSEGGFGASGVYFYQWQSNQGSIWTSIPGQQGTILSLPPLTANGLYRLQVSDADGCGTVTTNEVSIQVLPPFVPGSIETSTEVLCYGDTFTLTGQGATGADNDIDDVWMVSLNGGPFEESAVEALSWAIEESMDDYEIYLESTSGFGCGTITSNTVAVETLDPVEEPEVDFVSYDLTPLCFGDDAPELTVTQPTEGADGNWTYTWESSTDGETWTATQASSDNYSAGEMTVNTWFRMQSESQFGCGTVYSNQIEVDVHQSLTSPAIDLTLGDFGICNNTSPGAMTLTTQSTGGSEIWTYQWEVNVGSGWSAVSGETNSTYTPPALESSQSFRIVATEAQCGVRNSDAIEIEVFDPLSPSTEISSYTGLPLCDQNDGVLIILDVPPTGGGEGFTYQWQEVGMNLSDETETSLAVPFLELSTSYQLISTSTEGCGDVLSNVVEVNVYDPLEIQAAQGAQTICYSTSPDPLTNEGAFGGSSNYNYQWEQNYGGGWLTMDEETGTSLSPGAMEASSSFRLRVTDNYGCGSTTSVPVFVEVLNEFFPGSIDVTADELCFGDDFSVTSEGGQGADGDIDNVWYVSIDGGTFVDNQDLIDLAWTVADAQEDYDVYLESTSNFGCGTVYSDIVHVEVLDSIVSPQIAFDDYNGINLCYGDLAPATSVESLATGADGEWSYVWQQNGASNGWSGSQFDANTFEAGALFDSLQIRILGVSDFGCGSFESNVLMVPVWDEFLPGQISSSPEETICHLTAGSPLEATPAVGGGDAFEMQWMAFETASPFEIPDAQDLNLAPGILTDTTSYFLEYTNLNGCGTVVSNTIQISVLPALQSGVISGWDGETLCYGESVSLAIENVIDYPWLSHQWFVTDTADVQDALVNFQELSFDDLTLTESTTFTLETTSDFGCGNIQSESLEVTMWHALEAAEIDFENGFPENTLCYLDESPDFASTTTAFGGGGPLAYEWELQQGTAGSFEGTSVFSQDFYNPGELTDTVVVRLRVTDQYGCGTLVSNSLTLNVYAPLTIATQPDGQPICFGTSPIDLVSVASGGGDDYTLQWHSSEDNTDFGALDSQFSNQVFNLPLEQDTWFYLDVASNEGCGVIQSDTVFVDVQDPLIPGGISLADNPICAEEQGVLTSTPPQGGFDNFEYVWHVNIDGTWETQEEDGDSFVSTELLNNTFFYVSYNEDCGTVYSDTLELVVNPLPVINPIVGASTPCYNSINQEYRIPNWDWTMEYEWDVDSDFGEITSGETVDEILVNWGDQTGTTDVSVVVTNPETSCNDEFYFEVDITDVMAPPASIVVKKSGINLLVSADSTECAQHLWGVEDVLTGQLTYFPELNEQYAYFDDLDTLNFHYFVEVVYDCGDGPSCPTVNYYNHEPFVGVDDVEAAMTKVFPNPVRGQLQVQSSQKIQSLTLFTLSGRVIQSSASFNTPFATLELSDCPSGLYLLELKFDGGLTEIHRIVVD